MGYGKVMSTIADLDRETIIRELLKLRAELRGRGVTRLAIFGSRARGNPRPDSDLDVLIDVEPGIRFSLIDLIGASHIIGDELGIPANLFMRRSLEPGLAQTISDEIIEVF
jgi:predicted nucleotidyltransferase